MTEWQPIKTAPKNGTRIILATFRLPCIVPQLDCGFWAAADEPSSEDCWWSDDMDDCCSPTHWMPLPAPPKTGDNP